jgi:hypothetical protein
MTKLSIRIRAATEADLPVMQDIELPPGLSAIRDREVAHGLDRWPRVTMRRAL